MSNNQQRRTEHGDNDHRRTGPGIGGERGGRQLAEFDCFSWDRSNEIEDADQFCIVYTHHRDSGLLDESNAEAIAEAMEPFLDQEPCDVYEEHHNHWAVGWVEGYAIRVFRDGEITEGVSDLASTSNSDWLTILFSTKRTTQRRNTKRPSKTSQTPLGGSGGITTLPDGWASEVYRWLWDHECQRSKTEMTAAAIQRKRHCVARSMVSVTSKSTSSGPVPENRIRYEQPREPIFWLSD